MVDRMPGSSSTLLFVETNLPGSFVIELKQIEDARGFFARSFCAEEFRVRGLNPRVAQCNISHNRKKGTLRGMHYQAAPYEEARLVRCTRGALYDVIIDLRTDSLTFMKWTTVELSAKNRRMLYVPEGFAHGFQTLADDTEVFYQMSTPYHPGSDRGLRWDDPAFGVVWPEVDKRFISERDASFPLFEARR